ncbi:hypothetical protein BV22DRAFT_1134941 [Leucogyrophana mollusca]|uniref:Uncharacterized protein n=1 Tax=Leucogyrophana mollusca TaxID=85980 RepID=A0ACB8AWS2_9AGAM|nr:hypothetical protein BV22DRAFT_1134941 [Leucogyrophana mollusca]
MNPSGKREIITNYYKSSPFKQIVVFPTLAPQLIPQHLKENAHGPVAAAFTHQVGASGSSVDTNRNFGSVITNGRAKAPASSISIHNYPGLTSSSMDNAPQPELGAIVGLLKDYLISITMSCLQAETAAVPTCGGRAKVKKIPTTKHVRLVLDGMTRVQFLTEVLKVHGLVDEYRPEFPIKLWWSGSPGGQKQASSIENNNEFNTALSSIVKKPSTCNPLALANDEDDPTGTFKEAIDRSKVYHLNAARLNGHFILLIKNQWKCQLHTGEHGEPGFCFIRADSEHFGLNTRWLAIWGAAVVGGHTSILVPPNCQAFEGALIADQAAVSCPHRKTGPHAAPLPAASTPSGQVLDMNMDQAPTAPPPAVPPVTAATPPVPVSKELVEEPSVLLQAFQHETDIDVVH